MENSVIVLDSSEDEGDGSAMKKLPKQATRHPKLSLRKDKAPFVSASSFTITTTGAGGNMIPAKYRPSNNSAARITVSNVVSMSKAVNNNVRVVPGQKNFKHKIDTGEISLVPIPLNLSPLSTPSTSPASTIVSISAKRRQDSPNESPTAMKRICPIKISDVVSMAPLNRDADLDGFHGNIDNTHALDTTGSVDGNEEPNEEDKKSRKPKEKTPINDDFAQLLDACRKADSSVDMEKLINRKLVRYYQTVHPDFVNSKSFCKTIRSVIDEIKQNPNLVYLKISSVLEELNIRRKSGHTVVSNEEVVTTGNERKDTQIRKLNRALYVLKKQIAKLDEAEVNWDDEYNSTFLYSERLKKRACEIYEKICDITGESKNAQRLVKKPIKFQDTRYPEFNKTLQKFVNETKSFPDMFDVLRCLEHCNLQNGYRLTKDECKKIAQDAFLKVGILLQKRRKTDLYETVSYFTGTSSDPALDDTSLETKLAANQKFHKQINELIDSFAKQQDKTDPTIKPTETNQKSHVTDAPNDLLMELITKSDDPLNVNNNQEDVDGLLVIDRSRTMSEMDFLDKSDAVNSLLDGSSILSFETLDTSAKRHSEIIISDDEDL